MSTGAAHVGARKRKFAIKAKPSSGSTSGSLHGDLLSRMKVNLPELFAHPRKRAKSDDSVATTEGAASELRSNDEIKPTLEETSHEFEAELPSHDIVTAAESEREDNRPFVEEATIFDSKDDAPVMITGASSFRSFFVILFQPPGVPFLWLKNLNLKISPSPAYQMLRGNCVECCNFMACQIWAS
ncbi:hypothetical protein MRX96_046514 [Rhipicephalus microplus]